MGIQGLLRALQPLIGEGYKSTAEGYGGGRPTSTGGGGSHHVSEFRHQSLAVDASSWLHKAGYSCADRLVETVEGKIHDPTVVATIVRYMTRRCEELILRHGVSRVVLVFDGPHRCPLKADTNLDRVRRREENLRAARSLRARGKHEEASEKYRSCVKVPHEMAVQVASSIRQTYYSEKSRGSATGGAGRHPASALRERIQCIFAPFEADAQLAILCKERLCSAIITEDSDLLVYSAAINVSFPIVFKLDRTGSCDVLSMDWLLGGNAAQCDGSNDEAGAVHDKENGAANSSSSSSSRSQGVRGGPLANKKGQLAGCLRFFALRERRDPGAGRRMFVQACILCGCDYTPSLLPGVGLVGAFKMVKDQAGRRDDDRFQHILRGARGTISARGSSGNCSSSDEASSPGSSLSTAENVGIDYDAYELVLAKSVAVFYHHLIFCMNSNVVKPLQPFAQRQSSSDGDTRVAKGGCKRRTSSAKDHFPLLDRFGGDYSFLGHDFSSDELGDLKRKMVWNPTHIPPPPLPNSTRMQGATEKKSAAATLRHHFGGHEKSAKKQPSINLQRLEEQEMRSIVSTAKAKNSSSDEDARSWPNSNTSLFTMPKENPYKARRTTLSNSSTNPFANFAHGSNVGKRSSVSTTGNREALPTEKATTHTILKAEVPLEVFADGGAEKDIMSSENTVSLSECDSFSDEGVGKKSRFFSSGGHNARQLLSAARTKAEKTLLESKRGDSRKSASPGRSRGNQHVDPDPEHCGAVGKAPLIAAEGEGTFSPVVDLVNSNSNGGLFWSDNEDSDCVAVDETGQALPGLSNLDTSASVSNVEQIKLLSKPQSSFAATDPKLISPLLGGAANTIGARVFVKKRKTNTIMAGFAKQRKLHARKAVTRKVGMPVRNSLSQKAGKFKPPGLRDATNRAKVSSSLTASGPAKNSIRTFFSPNANDK